MKKIETKYSLQSEGHYVPAMEHKGIIYLSGQLSINPETGNIPDGGINVEAKQALDNLAYVLESSGLTKNSVIMCRVYISDVKYWSDVNKVYADFFGEHKPARVIVPSNNLHQDCLVEIEAIATREE